MKKKIAIVWGLLTASFVLTFLFFIYRYMWFSTDTIPAERWLVAGFGSLCLGMFYGMFLALEKPFN